MQKRIIVSMSSVFILLFITTSAFAQTYSERVERYKYWGNAYKNKKLFFRLSNTQVRSKGYEKIKKDYGWYWVDPKNRVWVAINPQKFKNYLRGLPDDEKARKEWERRIKEHNYIKPRVREYFKKEKEELLVLEKQIDEMAKDKMKEPVKEDKKPYIIVHNLQGRVPRGPGITWLCVVNPDDISGGFAKNEKELSEVFNSRLAYYGKQIVIVYRNGTRTREMYKSIGYPEKK